VLLTLRLPGDTSCLSVMFLDSSKTLKDVLGEFKDGGVLAKYNPEEVF